MLQSNSNRNFDRNESRNSNNFERNESRSSNHFDRNESRNNYRNDSQEYRKTIEIYQEKVGTVIGRGGSTIKELQSKFRIKVNVDRNQNQNGKIDVNLSGDKKDVEAAVNEINNLVEDRQYSHNKAEESKPEPMEFEPIDWQAAARECVSCTMML